MIKISFLDIVKQTILDRDKIITEHKIFADYQRANPEIIYELSERLKDSTGIQNIPDFEHLISLKEEYMIDDLSKIYKQLVKKNPLLNDYSEGVPIHYYVFEPNLYNIQLEKGYFKGDYDDEGKLVTGSNLAMKTIYLHTSSFVNFYYSIAN